MKRRRLWIAGIVLLVGLATYALSGRGPRNREPYIAEAMMSDGKHRLRLLKMVEGPLAYDWKDPTPPLLRKFLPQPLSPPHVPFSPVKLDGVPQGSMMSSDAPKTPDGASFLFRIVDEHGEYTHAPGLLFSNPRITFIDSSGYEYEQPWHAHAQAIWGVVGVCRGSVPRRDRMLKIKVQDGTEGRKPLFFEVDNPFYRSQIDDWRPMPLPATVSVGSASATLKSFSVSGQGHINARIAVSDFSYQVDHSSFWLEDATGNRGGPLSPMEASWKLHAKLDMHNMAVVDPESVYVLGEFQLPECGKSAHDLAHLEIEGVAIDLAVLNGGTSRTGDEPIDESRKTLPKEKPFDDDWPRMEVRARTSERGARVVTRLSSNGTVMKAALRPAGSGANMWEDTTLVFKRPNEDRPIKVEVAVVRPKEIEFLVAPQPKSKQP